jgi:ribosomal protein S6
MRQYEITYLIENEQDAPKIGELIGQFGGSIIREMPLGRRKLAYKIKKHDAAYYVSAIFDIDQKNLSPLERKLQLASFVIRHLVIARPVKKIDAHKEEAALERIEDSTEEEPVVADASVVEAAQEPIKETPRSKKTAKATGKLASAADGLVSAKDGPVATTEESVEKSADKAEETKRSEKKPKKISGETKSEEKTRQKALDEQLEKLLSEEF